MDTERINNSSQPPLTLYRQFPAILSKSAAYLEGISRMASATVGTFKLFNHLPALPDMTFIREKIGVIGEWATLIDLLNSVNWWINGKRRSIYHSVNMVCAHFRQFISGCKFVGINFDKLNLVIGTIPVLNLLTAFSRVIGFSFSLWHKFKVIEKTERNIQEKQTDLVFWRSIGSIDERVRTTRNLREQKITYRQSLQEILDHDEKKLKKMQIKLASIDSDTAQDEYLKKKAVQINALRGHIQYMESALKSERTDVFGMKQYIKGRSINELNLNTQKLVNATIRKTNEKIGCIFNGVAILAGVTAVAVVLGFASSVLLPVILLEAVTSSLGLFDFANKIINSEPYKTSPVVAPVL